MRLARSAGHPRSAPCGLVAARAKRRRSEDLRAGAVVHFFFDQHGPCCSQCHEHHPLQRRLGDPTFLWSARTTMIAIHGTYKACNASLYCRMYGIALLWSARTTAIVLFIKLVLQACTVVCTPRRQCSALLFLPRLTRRPDGAAVCTDERGAQ